MGRGKLCSYRPDFDRRCLGDGVDDPNRSRHGPRTTPIVLNLLVSTACPRRVIVQVSLSAKRAYAALRSYCPGSSLLDAETLDLGRAELPASVHSSPTTRIRESVNIHRDSTPFLTVSDVAAIVPPLRISHTGVKTQIAAFSGGKVLWPLET